MPLAATVIHAVSSAPLSVTSMTPPRGIAAAAIRHRFRISLTLFLGTRSGGTFHSSSARSPPKRPRATAAASPVSIERPGRTGGPESQPAKLQTRRSLPGAFLDEIERKAAHFRVLLLVEHLKAIDNGANRADHIVTDAGAKKRGEVEGVEGQTPS